MSSEMIKNKTIDKLDFVKDLELNDREEEDVKKSIEKEKDELQISNIKHDNYTFYEYGPKEEMQRFKYQPKVIKATKRSKVKLYTD